MAEPNDKIVHELKQAQAELWLLYEVSNLMRTTLELEQILYITLTAITSHEGLGFNRAMLFLVNEKGDALEGKIGIGPHTREEADKIWKGIEEQKMDLEDLIEAYDNFKKSPDTKLHTLVKGIHLPLKEEAGILVQTVLEGMPMEVTTEEARGKAEDKVTKAFGTKYFATVPLKAKDKVLGAIFVDNIFSEQPITKSDINILMLFANHAGLAIENSRLYERTVHLSNTDWQTELWNHGQFQFLLSQQIKKSNEEKTPVTIVMVDIDDFKNYNDKLGHVAGDGVIKTISDILRNGSRKKDFVCRYGGEEFSIILPNAGKDEARLIAERLRKGIEQHAFRNGKIQPGGKITASFGIATYPEDAKDKNSLIINADKALYQAKHKGKNCVYLYHLGI